MILADRGLLRGDNNTLDVVTHDVDGGTTLNSVFGAGISSRILHRDTLGGVGGVQQGVGQVVLFRIVATDDIAIGEGSKIQPLQRHTGFVQLHTGIWNGGGSDGSAEVPCIRVGGLFLWRARNIAILDVVTSFRGFDRQLLQVVVISCTANRKKEEINNNTR